MKKIIILSLSALLLIFLISSNPNKQDHRDKLRGDIIQIVNNELTSAGIEDAWTSSPEFKEFVEELALGAVDVDNYLLFSIGKIDLPNKSQVVSFGIGGHVFTFNDKVVKNGAALAQRVKEKYNSLRK